MSAFRDSVIFAFFQGAIERLRHGDAAGRTHATRRAWNEAYDMGMNLADRIKRRTA